MHYQSNEVIPKMSGMWVKLYRDLLGWSDKQLSGKHTGCPHCMGVDRFRFTDKINRSGDGGAICNQCGSDSGVGWFMKCSGLNYSEAIDTLGEWLNLVPVEIVNKANKVASRDSGYNFGAQAPHENCVSVMERTKPCINTPLSVFEGFYLPDDEKYQCGLKTRENGTTEFIHAIPCHLVHSDELDDEMCNILFVNEEGESSFYARDYTRGSVAVTGNTDKTIYLCVNWIDAQHIHLATGQEIWCCFSPSNLEIVAHRYKGDRKMRVVCHADDTETLIAADERQLDVMIPIGGNFKKGIERRLYKAESLL